MGTNVVKKINSCLKFLYRNSGFLNFNHRKLLSIALLQCQFDYAYNVYYRGLEKSIKTNYKLLKTKWLGTI